MRVTSSRTRTDFFLRLAVTGAGLAGAIQVHAQDPEPLPFPVYLACRIDGEITVDGKLTDRATGKEERPDHKGIGGEGKPAGGRLEDGSVC